MINAQEVEAIKKELEEQEKLRESTIQQAQGIIRLSKEVIYALHRSDLVKAEARLALMKEQLSNLPICTSTNMDHAAAMEYVEAAAFYHLLTKGVIPTRGELEVDTYPYLMGLSDLTGELLRKAFKDVIEKKFDHAIRMADAVDQIYYAFLQFDLRGSELRRKADQIKYNLAKLEDMRYQLALTTR